MKAYLGPVLSLCLLFSAAMSAAQTGGGAYFPSNLDPVKEVFVVYNASNADLTKSLLRLVKSINAKSQAAQKIKLTVFHRPSDKAVVQKMIDAEIQKDVQLLPRESADDETGGVADWLQDSGEFFYDSGNRLSFLFNSDSIDHQPFIEYLLKSRQVKGVDTKDGNFPEALLEGGDIEALPGGRVYVGNRTDQTVVQALTKLAGKNNLLMTTADHSNVGHVDESFQIVPASPESSNGCGYALAYTDYLDGLRIGLAFGLFGSVDEGHDGPSRTVSNDDYLQALSYLTGTPVEKIEMTNTFFYQLTSAVKNTPRAFKSILGFRKEDVYIYKALLAQKQILESVALLKKQAALAGCQTLKTVSVPALWTFNSMSGFFPMMPESFAEVAEAKMSNLTAFTNFIVLNDRMVIPDAPKNVSQILYFQDQAEVDRVAAKLKEILTTRLTGVGLKSENLHFVNVDGSLLGDGAAHCKTQVIRSKR